MLCAVAMIIGACLHVHFEGLSILPNPDSTVLAAAAAADFAHFFIDDNDAIRFYYFAHFVQELGVILSELSF